MPKFAPDQPRTAAHIDAVLAYVSTLAHDASKTDKALLNIAHRAQHFASVWVRCTTEAGRREMTAVARELSAKAIAESKTPVSLALFSLGFAFQQFAQCNYRHACRHATEARRVADVSPATVARFM